MQGFGENHIFFRIHTWNRENECGSGNTAETTQKKDDTATRRKVNLRVINCYDDSNQEVKPILTSLMDEIKKAIDAFSIEMEKIINGFVDGRDDKVKGMMKNKMSASISFLLLQMMLLLPSEYKVAMKEMELDRIIKTFNPIEIFFAGDIFKGGSKADLISLIESEKRLKHKESYETPTIGRVLKNKDEKVLYTNGVKVLNSLFGAPEDPAKCKLHVLMEETKPSQRPNQEFLKGEFVHAIVKILGHQYSPTWESENVSSKTQGNNTIIFYLCIYCEYIFYSL